jgi:hypothetical protein
MNYPEDGDRDAVYVFSNANVAKADNIRLQDARLSYQFDRSNWKSIPFRGLQLYAYGSNLGILWRANKLGIDPDYVSSPVAPRTFALGFKLEL